MNELDKKANDWITHLSSKDARNQLIYLETRAVDHDGRVDQRMMNADDFTTTARMVEDGIVKFGRVYSGDVNQYGAYWTKLTPLGWKIVGLLRQQRADRLWKSRNFMTTQKRAA